MTGENEAKVQKESSPLSLIMSNSKVGNQEKSSKKLRKSDDQTPIRSSRGRSLRTSGNLPSTPPASPNPVSASTGVTFRPRPISIKQKLEIRLNDLTCFHPENDNNAKAVCNV